MGTEQPPFRGSGTLLKRGVRFTFFDRESRFASTQRDVHRPTNRRVRARPGQCLSFPAGCNSMDLQAARRLGAEPGAPQTHLRWESTARRSATSPISQRVRGLLRLRPTRHRRSTSLLPKPKRHPPQAASIEGRGRANRGRTSSKGVSIGAQAMKFRWDIKA
jgi:hypothetical protein